MKEKKEEKPQERYVYVKDRYGTEYVCRLSDLKRPDEMTDEEKENCMIPPGDA